MSLLRPPSAINFLYASASSSFSSCTSSLSPRLLFHRTWNGAIVDCGIIGRRTLMPPYGKKGISPLFPFSSLSLDVSASTDSHFLSTSVGSPPQSLSLPQWNLGPRHILLLNIIACTVAISASCLFFSAIPTLLAFKKAAESLEKLLDVTAEELPDTMATMRLCGMEISDLTMELSDLGLRLVRLWQQILLTADKSHTVEFSKQTLNNKQEQNLTADSPDSTAGPNRTLAAKSAGIKHRVRSSTRAVHVAEERLRRLTTMDPIVSTQGHSSPKQMEILPLAKRARSLREGIVKGRALFGVIYLVSQFSRWAWNFYILRVRSSSTVSNQVQC